MMNEDNKDKLYLITARHVAADFDSGTIIDMMGKSQNIISVNLSFLQNSLGVIYHPSADLCAIEIDVARFNGINADVALFTTRFIDKPKIVNISRDTELTSFGFPNGLGTNRTFSPLTFRSHPASNIIKQIQLSNNNKSDVFLLENPSCGGYSGGPVLDLGYLVAMNITQSSNTLLYGVIHGNIFDRTGGKMAVVTPAYYLLDII